MKPVLTLLFAALFLFSCGEDSPVPNAVYVKFVNQTGSPIRNATVDAQPIGDLAASATSSYVRFKQFGTDTGFPDAKFEGQINGETYGSTSKFFWCGTEKSKLKPGKYTVVVTLSEGPTESLFDLRFK